MSDPFDVIPFEDIKGDWKKLGSGSFGNVYMGSYLGIDVAIKEVLPSNDYDVAKYFEREWRLLKESRHPNVVLYLGLSRAPDPDGRIFIISEFIENGNLRAYIHDKHKPFPWRLRISFATDITRALAYLHARKCIHRDLKGENLLVTSNGRLKITDFGFARIAARNAEELRRLTFCGTDSYMSPEILLGNEFDLPTDIFSLGVIFAEIASRKLADDRTFKRTAPTFAVDEREIRELASAGCPKDFVRLAIDCLVEEPSKRPTTREILERLRACEAEVLARGSEADDIHTGSIKFMSGNKRPGTAPRIPSFGMGIGKDIGNGNYFESDDDSDEELKKAVAGLSKVTVSGDPSSSIIAQGHGESQQPLIDTSSSTYSDYSTTVVRSHPQQSTYTVPALSSILTVRPNGSPLPGLDPPTNYSHIVTDDDSAASPQDSAGERPSSQSMVTIDSFHTASSSMYSTADATEGGSTIRSVAAPGMVHRFTLIKPGAKKGSISVNGTASGSTSPQHHPVVESWGPLDFFFSSGLLGGAKCDICGKRLGRKPVLECDDCGLRTHAKCGEVAPMDCGIRPPRPNSHQLIAPQTPPTKGHKSKPSTPFSAVK